MTDTPHPPLPATEAAERFLAAGPVAGPVDAFVSVDGDEVRAQAAASDAHARARAPRRPLEGVLVGVKDVFHVRGYVTRAGTSFLAVDADEDAVAVKRLRDAGAVIAGKNRMSELGVSPVGVSRAGGTPRNPHDARRAPGGSTSGGAAAVAAGLVPLALGTDAAGDVRIPAALCGVLGFKPTFGRVTLDGRAAVGWWSLDHAGVIARSAELLMTAYGVLAGERAASPRVATRVGVDWAWWGVPEDAVDAACRAAVAALPVEAVRIDHLSLAQPSAYTTAAAELAAALHAHDGTRHARIGPDVRALLHMATTLSAVDYVRAQQARTLLATAFARAFRDVDLLVTPTTACTAPQVSDPAREHGLFDETLFHALTRYAFPANLVGLPAATVPVAVVGDALPVGLQIIGPPGADAQVLAFAADLHARGIAAPVRPGT